MVRAFFKFVGIGILGVLCCGELAQADDDMAKLYAYLPAGEYQTPSGHCTMTVEYGTQGKKEFFQITQRAQGKKDTFYWSSEDGWVLAKNTDWKWPLELRWNKVRRGQAPELRRLRIAYAKGDGQSPETSGEASGRKRVSFFPTQLSPKVCQEGFEMVDTMDPDGPDASRHH